MNYRNYLTIETFTGVEWRRLHSTKQLGLFIEHPRTATLDRAIAEARGSDAGLNAERDNQIVASSDSGKR